MALKLAEGEVIVKEYDYSKSIAGQLKGLTTQSRLIVTNKRIIDEKACYAPKNERISRNEIPLKKATKVSTSFKRRGNALWILLCIVSVIAMIACFASGGSSKSSRNDYASNSSYNDYYSDYYNDYDDYDDYNGRNSSSKKSSGGGATAFGIVFLVLAILFVVLYIFLRKSAVRVLIGTDSHMTPIMGLSSTTEFRFVKAPQIDMYGETVKIMLDAEVAMDMVDEIGAAILDAQNYVVAASEAEASVL